MLAEGEQKSRAKKIKNMSEVEGPARGGQASEDGAASGRPHSPRLPLIFEIRSNFFENVHTQKRNKNDSCRLKIER